MKIHSELHNNDDSYWIHSPKSINLFLLGIHKLLSGERKDDQLQIFIINTTPVTSFNECNIGDHWITVAFQLKSGANNIATNSTKSKSLKQLIV